MDLIYEFKDHFSYLKHRLNPKVNTWGNKAKFAEHLRTQSAFISQVLSKKYCLNLEQADLANQYFQHDHDESHFFMLLVSRDRSGSESLKQYYQQQIKAVLDGRKRILNRLGLKMEISEVTQGLYYSSWIYPTVHVACTIPELQTRNAIAQYLQVPQALVGKALAFLEANGLLKKENDRYVPTQTWLRLGADSPYIIKMHTNWRTQAIQNLEFQTEDDLHYSGIFSLDEKTALKIKEEFLDFIKKQVKKIEAAPEENLYVMAVDFFLPFKPII